MPWLRWPESRSDLLIYNPLFAGPCQPVPHHSRCSRCVRLAPSRSRIMAPTIVGNIMKIAVFAKTEKQYQDFLHTGELEASSSKYQLVRNDHSLGGLRIEKVV